MSNKTKQIKFIVTNTCAGGEYTPSVFKTKKEAKDWIKECTAENLRDAFGDEKNKLNELSDKKVIEWALENLRDFRYNKESSFIQYSDDTYNSMNLYKIKDIIH